MALFCTTMRPMRHMFLIEGAMGEGSGVPAHSTPRQGEKWNDPTPRCICTS